MNLSLGEFRALVAKAFRGAGYSWGLTEEAAFAAGRLAEFGLPAGEIVVRLLTLVDGLDTGAVMPDARWMARSGMLCPVCVGASIADLGGCDALSLGPTAEPLLIAPFLSALSVESRSVPYSITWSAGSCVVDAGAIAVSGELPAEPVPVSISTRSDADMNLPGERRVTDRAARVELDSPTAKQLERLANRVYAPASEASRIAGAGAGTTDND